MIASHDIKLALSDVDGTLVTHDKILTHAAIAAVADLRDAGIAFAITSSRPPLGLRMLIEPLGLQGPIAGCNGGNIVNPDFSTIVVHRLGLEAAQRAYALLAGHGLDVWVYTEDNWIVPRSAGPHVAREAWILKFGPIVSDTVADADLANAIKIVGVSDNENLIAACEKKVQEALGESVSAERSQSYFLDVTHPQANKGAVVAALAKRLNIRADQIVTIGDMPNDILMFRRSGLSIAMGNASDDVKAQANLVTDSSENDGFAKAMQQFVLQNAPA